MKPEVMLPKPESQTNLFKPSVDVTVCEIGVKITHIPNAEMVQWYNYLKNLSYLLEAGSHLMNAVTSEQVYFINLSLILDSHKSITYEWERTLIQYNIPESLCHFYFIKLFPGFSLNWILGQNISVNTVCQDDSKNIRDSSPSMQAVYLEGKRYVL